MKQITTLLLVLCSSLVCAQNTYELSGVVLDANNQRIALGDVLLLVDGNEVPVKYTFVDEGIFSFGSVIEGVYLLRVSCLGFKPYDTQITLNRKLHLNIQLTESTTNLDEVEVIAAKPIVTNKNGNLKMDVTNPVFTSIPDPMELLSKLPNLQVSPDRESVTVIGKGAPLLYIGNQRISMEEFNALSVADISSIEIIKNPSAKYEADGRAVLLITRKVSDTEGIKVNLSETLSFKQNFNNYNSLNVSFKKKKLTLKVNLTYNDLETWESHQFEFSIPEADVLSDYLVLIDPNDRVQLNTGGGLYYQINDDDYFSANTTIRLQTDDFIIDTDTFLRQGLQEENIVTKTGNDNTKDFISGNFNYNKKLNSKINLFTGIQYSSFVQRLNTEISNNFNTTEFIRSQDRQQKYRIDVLAYRLDVEKTFENNMKLEIGTNISDARANALSNIQFFESDTNMNVDYGYTEKTYAGYAQLSGNLTKKINFNAGLRIENNQVKGEVETDVIPLVNRKNTNLFPKAMFNFEIDSTKSLTFTYSRSIERPNYSKASSISVFINPFLEGAGNVNLKPTITEELSMNFQLKNNSLNVSYSHAKNPRYYTISYDGQADRAIFSLNNLTEESGFDITLTAPITKGKWISTNSITLSNRKIKDPLAEIKNTKPFAYFYTDQQFKIGKDTTVSFGGWAFTKRNEGIFQRNSLLVFNAAITKTFFEKLHCALRFNDITKAMNFEESYAINGVEANGTYFADGREIALSIKYSLGKIKDPSYKNKDIDENLDRIR